MCGEQWIQGIFATQMSDISIGTLISASFMNINTFTLGVLNFLLLHIQRPSLVPRLTHARWPVWGHLSYFWVVPQLAALT